MKKFVSSPKLPFIVNYTEAKIGEGLKRYERPDFTLLSMTMVVTMTSVNEMPIVAPYSGIIPKDIRGIHRLNHCSDSTVAPHFYFNDGKIRKYFDDPFGTEEILSNFDVSISIDFSMTKEMARPQKVYSSFLNKLWEAWMQSRGFKVIPNVSFPYEYEDDYWIEGWPKNSIIAMSSVGVLTHGNPIVWNKGADRVRTELLPLHILRYGPKIPGENTENCTYFDNDNKRSANGW